MFFIDSMQLHDTLASYIHAVLAVLVKLYHVILQPSDHLCKQDVYIESGEQNNCNILFRKYLTNSKLKFICIKNHTMPRDKGQLLVVVGTKKANNCRS